MNISIEKTIRGQNKGLSVKYWSLTTVSFSGAAIKLSAAFSSSVSVSGSRSSNQYYIVNSAVKSVKSEITVMYKEYG